MKESEEIIEEAVSAEIELDGKIYYLEKDKDGNELLREELPGKEMVKALALIVKEVLDNLSSKESEE